MKTQTHYNDHICVICLTDFIAFHYSLMMKSLEGSVSLQAWDILRYSLCVKKKEKADEFQPTFWNSFSQFPVLWSQHLQRETARPALMNWWSPDKPSFNPSNFLLSRGAATFNGTCNR